MNRFCPAHLDGISDEDIAALNIPTGIPLRYDIDRVTLRPITAGGEYLDPEAAKEAAAAVANQGGRRRRRSHRCACCLRDLGVDAVSRGRVTASTP
jgi:hypothetical protein